MEDVAEDLSLLPQAADLRAASKKAARNRSQQAHGSADAGLPADAQSDMGPPEEGESDDSPRDMEALREDLQRQLQEKDELIVALTDRLEQAAEQLDRLRRNGTDRGGRRGGGGGSLPPDLVEDHRAVVEDLKQAITRWEDMQAAAALGRLETQVSELRDLVTGYVNSSAPRSGQGNAARGGAAAKPGHSPATWWEMQKAAILGDSPAPEQPAGAGPAPADHSAPAQSAEPVPAAESFNLQDANLPDLPPAVDWDNLSPDEARQAICARDDVINQLREPLLLLQAAGRLPADLKSLDGIPESLREFIDQLEAAWQAKFRQAELDLSLERARLSRAEAAVRQQQDQQRPEHSGSADADGRPRSKQDKSKEDDHERRWFRFLGTGKE